MFGFYILRLLKNLTVSANLQKRVDFFEVTGVRALKKSRSSIQRYGLCKDLYW